MNWLEHALSIEGWMSDEELTWLYNMAATMRTVVEVGCWKGRSAVALAEGCKGTVWTVDHFRGSPSELETSHAEAAQPGADIESQARENLVQYQNLRIIARTSLSASRLFPAHGIDMVFIDGEHTRESVLIDLLCWTPKVRLALCGHDIDIQGVAEALAIYGLPFACGPGSIWFMELEG